VTLKRVARPELVIFDCDGVLVDSEPISNRVLAERLTAAGLEISATESRARFQGMMLSEVVSSAEEQFGRPLPPGFLERFEADRAVAFTDELRPIPGAAAAVQAVKAAGVAVCVASQGQLSKTRLTLSLTGLLPLIGADALFSAYAVPRGKPFPDLFLHAADVMGAAPPDCVVVEDSQSGVRAAVAAGMRVLGFPADGNEAPLRDAGAELLPTLDELVRHLQIT
jgi:HAD superfamily hydrolase (TIGR01509 family)